MGIMKEKQRSTTVRWLSANKGIFEHPTRPLKFATVFCFCLTAEMPTALNKSSLADSLNGF